MLLTKLKLPVTEEYHSLVGTGLNKKTYTIFIDPTKDEIKELARESNSARFIVFQNHLYIFSAEVLHSFAIKHLGFPISNDPPVKYAFLGIAKPNLNGTLVFTDSNQTLSAKDSADLERIHGKVLSTYFK